MRAGLYKVQRYHTDEGTTLRAGYLLWWELSGHLRILLDMRFKILCVRPS